MDAETKARIFKEGGKILGDLVKVVMTRSTKRRGLVEGEDVQIELTSACKPEPSTTTTLTTTTSSLPTTEETTRELKRRLAKELYRAELDLSAKLRIAGKPCDCLSDKHTLMLEAAAEELISNEPNNTVYFEIIGWIKDNQAKVTIPAISTGQYDDEYPVMAAQFREFRKRVLGTTQIAAMVEPKVEVESEPIESHTVIPNSLHPRPPLETDLEYLADSPEFLTQTIDNTGCRSKLDNAFQEAIARVKGLK